MRGGGSSSLRVVSTMLPGRSRAGYDSIGEESATGHHDYSESNRSTNRRLALVISAVGILLGCVATVLYSAGQRASSGQVTPPGDDSLALRRKGKGRKGNVAPKCPVSPKSTLQLEHEEKMSHLFGVMPKYEASGLTVAEGHLFIVCDSSWAIYQVDDELVDGQGHTLPNDMLQRQDDIGGGVVGHKFKRHIAPDEDSAYEGIYYDEQDDLFYVVRESLPHVSKSGRPSKAAPAFHAHIEEIRLKGTLAQAGGGGVKGELPGPTNHTIVDFCPTQDLFSGDSKGLEGLIGIRSKDGSLYLLGLCEGNHCAQNSEGGTEKGNGVIVVLRKLDNRAVDATASCAWTTVSYIRLPKTAEFRDFSGVDYNAKTGMLAVVSQEEAKIWLGQLINPSGAFDPLTSYLDEGRVLDFPRDDECEVIYCNIEGVGWLADDRIATVSDRMKRGRQDPRCAAKDQSVQVWNLPPLK